jgi:hypothetical protein
MESFGMVATDGAVRVRGRDGELLATIYATPLGIKMALGVGTMVRVLQAPENSYQRQRPAACAYRKFRSL